MDALDARILDWEATHPNPSEGAALAAATKLGITRTTWNMRLLRILDTPDALERDAVTVYRLKRHLERGMQAHSCQGSSTALCAAWLWLTRLE